MQSIGDGGHMAGRWFTGVIFALGFTSALMHYYYDGFIWKIRHKENQEYLGGVLPTESKVSAQSWWEESSARSRWEGMSRSTARGAVSRQCLYFALPILFLSATYWIFHEDSLRSKPIGHAVAASSLAEARAAIVAMEEQLEVESVMIRIRSRSKHHTYQADLLYMTGVARMWVAEQLGTNSDLLREERRQSLGQAIASMKGALELGPPYGHLEDPEMSREDIEERLLEWRLELQET